MANSPITLRVAEDSKQQFIDYFTTLKEREPNITQAEAFTRLITERMQYVNNNVNTECNSEGKEEYSRMQEEYTRIQNECTRIQTENIAQQERINVLQAECITLKEQLKNLELNVEEESKQITELTQEKIHLQSKTILDLLKPYTAKLLSITAERLSAKYKREIEPIDVLSDMFLKYTIERYSLWFYDFVIKDTELIELAQQINPEITSIKQIKQIVICK